MEVSGTSHGGVENTGFLSFGCCPVFEPSDGERDLFGVRFVVRAPAHEGLSPHQGGAVFRQPGSFFVCSVDVRWSPNVAHTPGNGVVFEFFDNVATSGISMPSAVVAHEGSPDEIPAKVDVLSVDLVGKVSAEAMVCGAQGY